MALRCPLALLSCLIVATSCKSSEAPAPLEPGEPEAPAESASAPPPAPEARGRFIVEAGESSELDWRPPSNLVSCRWYPEPERGDYLWIRLAQTPEQDGDAGARLDIDVCRLRAGGSGRYAPMTAGEHGSHCAAEPGFAIWWHEGEAAFHNGPSAAPEGCWLELDLDERAGTVAGRFACAALERHEQDEAGSGSNELELAGVGVREGRFACRLEQVPVDP
jgi:hypothetical protein